MLRGSTDEKYLHQFRQIVWRQLVLTEIDFVRGLDTLSAPALEGKATCFPPVSVEL